MNARDKHERPGPRAYRKRMKPRTDELNPGRLPLPLPPKEMATSDEAGGRRRGRRGGRGHRISRSERSGGKCPGRCRSRDSRRADLISVAVVVNSLEESVTSVAVAPEALAQEASSPQPASTAEAVVESRKRKIRSPRACLLQSPTSETDSPVSIAGRRLLPLGDCA